MEGYQELCLKGWDWIYKIFTIFCFILIVALFLTPSIVAEDSFVKIEVSQPFKDKVVKAGGPADFIVDVEEFIPSTEAPVVNGRQDVKFFYKLYNNDGRAIIDDSETINLTTDSDRSPITSYQKTFYIPIDSKGGRYTLEVIASVNDSELGSDEISFDVVRITDESSNLILFVLAAGFIVAICAFLYERRKVRKLKVSKKDFEKYL